MAPSFLIAERTPSLLRVVNHTGCRRPRVPKSMNKHPNRDDPRPRNSDDAHPRFSEIKQAILNPRNQGHDSDDHGQKNNSAYRCLSCLASLRTFLRTHHLHSISPSRRIQNQRWQGAHPCSWLGFLEEVGTESFATQYRPPLGSKALETPLHVSNTTICLWEYPEKSPR